VTADREAGEPTTLTAHGTSSVDFAGPMEPAGRGDRRPSDFSPPIQSPYDDLFIAHVTCIFGYRGTLYKAAAKIRWICCTTIFLSAEAQGDIPHAYPIAVSI
jgi:hypothetical protein